MRLLHTVLGAATCAAGGVVIGGGDPRGFVFVSLGTIALLYSTQRSCNHPPFVIHVEPDPAVRENRDVDDLHHRRN